MKWGMFTFRIIPFGLVNVNATFQRSMDITFHRLIVKSALIYLDDVTVFSKKNYDHLHHLKKIFEQCWKYRISLNPKKNIFVMSKANLLDHIITKSGIKVESERVRSIM